MLQYANTTEKLLTDSKMNRYMDFKGMEAVQNNFLISIAPFIFVSPLSRNKHRISFKVPPPAMYSSFQSCRFLGWYVFSFRFMLPDVCFWCHWWCHLFPSLCYSSLSIYGSLMRESHPKVRCWAVRVVSYMVLSFVHLYHLTPYPNPFGISFSSNP